LGGTREVLQRFRRRDIVDPVPHGRFGQKEFVQRKIRRKVAH
jgi:hypothetical protein